MLSFPPDPKVAMGLYATVLFVLGRAYSFGDLADPRIDCVGLQLEEERPPQRIRTRTNRKKIE